MTNKKQRQKNRKARVRARIFGTGKVPRLTIHKSNKYLSTQLVDDDKQASLFGFTTKKLTKKGLRSKKDAEAAKALGEKIAKMAKSKKIKNVSFDRSGYRYHGVVKSFADAARKGGLKF